MANGKIRQRTVYWATAALVACMVGGFALAAVFSTGGQNTTYQGSQSTTVDPIAGLQYASTGLTQLTAGTGAPGCSVGSPCDVTSANETVCVGGYAPTTSCAAQDYVEQDNLTTTIGTEFSGTTHTVKLTMFVTGTPAGGSGTSTVASASFYFSESAAPTFTTTITLDFDLGNVTTGPGTVTGVTVIGNA
jgi:hypothetical protein